MMKNILLLTRNDGSDGIIEALMQYNDVHIVLAVTGTREEREVAESYKERIDLIYAWIEGDLSNLEDVTDLDYTTISQCKEVESDFEDGTGRFIQDHAMRRYRYYASLSFWNRFFKKNTIDCVIIRGLTHGMVHDVIPLYFAKRRNIPCYQLEDNYFSLGSLFLPNEDRYMDISLGMELAPERCMYYSLGTTKPIKVGIKTWCARVLEKIGGYLLLNSVSDILHGRKQRSLFGICYSEYTITRALLLYFEYKRLYSYMKRLSQPVNYRCKYVIYYLHFEPEATIQVRCTLKSQLVAIKMLSESLPKGWTLYVKEHPYQYAINKSDTGLGYQILAVNRYKNKNYYDKIASMPHTILASPEESSAQINKHAMAIATFNGTVAIEATKEKKPILLFGAETTWLQYCDDFMKITSFQSCKNALEKICTGWQPRYRDLTQVMNRFAYPITPKGAGGVIRKIMEKEGVEN